MTELPKYRSHKIVRAAMIVGIDASTGIVTVKLPGGAADSVSVPDGWERKIGSQHHDGDLGYLVEYDDGYMSWSPSKAFEEGYTAIDETKSDEPGRFYFASDDDGHNYLVAEEHREAFEAWSEMATESDDFDPDGYPGTRIDGTGEWTFTGPRRGDS